MTKRRLMKNSGNTVSERTSKQDFRAKNSSPGFAKYINYNFLSIQFPETVSFLQVTTVSCIPL